VDEDLAADMYELAREYLGTIGYEHYEISNWALSSEAETFECQHNLQYWHDLPYLGFGAGAHGYAGGIRTANVLGITVYINRLKGVNKGDFPASPAAVTATKIDPGTEAQEMMMVGLRLVKEGVSTDSFQQRIGKPLMEVFGKEVNRLVYFGLLEWVGEGDSRIRLTRKGQLLGNQVFMQFVGETV
jgi:oxygen-independent coproporphyrinogen-3 oxidase